MSAVCSDPRLSRWFSRPTIRVVIVEDGPIWEMCWRCGGQRREFLQVGDEWRWRPCITCLGLGELPAVER